MMGARGRLFSLLAAASLVTIGCGGDDVSTDPTVESSGSATAITAAGATDTANAGTNDLTGVQFEVRRDPG